MNLQSLARNARLYARAEGLVAEIRLRLLVRKLVLSLLAVAFALLGLVFVNMALFNYLVSAWGPVWTPLALGLVNFALAIPVLLIAASAKPGPELAMAEDLRKAAGAALNVLKDNIAAAIDAKKQKLEDAALELVRARADEHREETLALSLAIAELSSKLREALYLHAYAGMTFREAGAVLGVPTFTAASRYRLALRRLEKRLGGGQ